MTAFDRNVFVKMLLSVPQKNDAALFPKSEHSPYIQKLLEAFDKEEPKLVERVFCLSDMDAGDIMTNRTQMDWIDLEDEEGQIMNDLLAFHQINVPV